MTYCRVTESMQFVTFLRFNFRSSRVVGVYFTLKVAPRVEVRRSEIWKPRGPIILVTMFNQTCNSETEDTSSHMTVGTILLKPVLASGGYSLNSIQDAILQHLCFVDIKINEVSNNTTGG